MINFCEKCLYTSRHPLGIEIENGVCSGCKTHAEKYKIDWGERFTKLTKVVGEYKCTTSYDCIIPVTGGKDSFFTVDFVKNNLGLNPLLVTYNTHFTNGIGARNLAKLRTQLDCDLLFQTLSPKLIKAITKTTLKEYGNIYWHVQAGQSVFPVQTAVRLKIPLIIWGVHQGVDQVGMFSHHEYVEMNERYQLEHDLMFISPTDVSTLGNINVEKLEPFRYPSQQELSAVGVRGIYLNNYVFWDSRSQHIAMNSRYGYDTYRSKATYDIWNDVHCSVYLGLHDELRYKKHGYRKIVDHLTRDIRLNYHSRTEALQILKQYDIPINEAKWDAFCEWLGITPNALKYFLDKHTNKRLFERDIDTWQWRRRPGTSIFDQNHTANGKKTELHFETLQTISSDTKSEFILIPRGVK